jgi:hypothetical protein
MGLPTSSLRRRAVWINGGAGTVGGENGGMAAAESGAGKRVAADCDVSVGGAPLVATALAAASACFALFVRFRFLATVSGEISPDFLFNSTYTPHSFFFYVSCEALNTHRKELKCKKTDLR